MATKRNSKPVKPDWFDKNIPCDDERYLARLAVNTLEKIERDFGRVYHDTFIELLKKLKNQNYQEQWKKTEQLINT
jgi:hypothetical protein